MEEEGVTAVVVSRNFTSRLLDPEDLAHYTQLRRAHLLQRVGDMEEQACR